MIILSFSKFVIQLLYINIVVSVRVSLPSTVIGAAAIILLHVARHQSSPVLQPRRNRYVSHTINNDPKIITYFIA